jgi:leucyl-tRNA synthetase
VFSIATGPLSNSPPEGEVLREMHKTIKKVSGDIDKMAFNTAISNMMVFCNTLTALDQRPREAVETLVLLLAPFAPHVAEEAWELLGHSKKCASLTAWPVYDEELCLDTTAVIAIQINGKVRGKMEVDKSISQDDAMSLAREVDLVKKYLDGMEVKKIIFVPGRILNIVVGGKVAV